MNTIRNITNWITGIGWTDLGTATALSVAANLLADAGRDMMGLFCVGLAVVVYVSAPRESRK